MSPFAQDPSERWSHSSQDRLPAAAQTAGWLAELQHRMINLLLGTIVALGTAGMAYTVVRLLTEKGNLFNLAYYSVAYLLVVILFLFKRIPDFWRAFGFLSVLYVFACFALYSGWLASGGRSFLLALIVGATVLISPLAGWVAAGASLLTYAGFGLAFSQGWLTLRQLPSPVLAPPIITEGIGFLLAIGIAGINLWFTRRALDVAVESTSQAQEAQALLTKRAEELDAANQALAERSQAAEQARGEAVKAQQVSEEQAWLSVGQTMLSNAMRLDPGTRDQSDALYLAEVNELAKRIVQSLCQYLGAEVGALYIWDGNAFVWAGGYALSEPPVPSFQPGEGLAGQVVFSAADSDGQTRLLQMDNLPPGYLKVVSGLGKGKPQQVLIAPLHYHSQVIGVVELGALQKMAPRSKEFLEQSAESMAIALRAAQTRQQVAALLAETQRQASELQAQQEELRAINEELQARAERRAGG